MSPRALSIAILLLLVGCAFPFPHWNRYHVSTQVLNDETGEPVGGALVVVEVFHQRSPVPSHYFFYRTDGEGRLEIAESKDWQVTPPLPEAISIDIQFLTVYKSGYLPYQLKGTTSDPIRLRPADVREVIEIQEQVVVDGNLIGDYQLNFGSDVVLSGAFRSEWDPTTQSLFFKAADTPIHYGEDIPTYSVQSIRSHEKVKENTLIFAAPNRIVLAGEARYFPSTGLIEFLHTRAYSRQTLIGSAGMSISYDLQKGSLRAER